MKYVGIFCFAVSATFLVSQSSPPREQVGPLSDGFLLNSGWKLKPAGRQIPLDTFPMSTALSKDGKFLLVLNGGQNPPSISVLVNGTMEETARVPVPDGWLGLAFSPDGKNVYVGGGSRASVFEFTWNDGKLVPARTLEIVPEAKRAQTDFIGDVTVSPDGRMLYAAGVFHNAIHRINLQSGRVIDKFASGRRPYRILLHPDGRSYFVSSWADGSVYHHNADTGERLGLVRLGQHPTDMVWRPRKSNERSEGQAQWAARLFVAAANTNTVFSVGVSESKDLKMIESINVAMTARQPAGMTPTGLSLNSDQSRLFVVCSDTNAVAVVDITEDTSKVLGFVPTGWYPTAARAVNDGRLIVINGLGIPSYPKGSVAQTGTASVIDSFNDDELDAYTKTVLSNSPYRDEKLDVLIIPQGNPVPARPGDASPIKHVLYIVKEGRTYDQVLGNLGKGNGDPSLTVFDEKSAPNHYKLAREFVLFDNFYVNGDVAADGLNWSAAAIASDYVRKMSPNSHGGRRKQHDYEGGEVASLPPAGYLWTNALAAGLSIRNYGWWATNGPKAAQGQPQITAVRDPALAKFTNRNFRASDPDYADVQRAQVFLDDLKQFEASGAMPQVMFMRIGNDRTSGTASGMISPLSAMADNDYALGMIVEGLTKSKFWPQTAIFVLEADTQNGADHVDSHRSPAYIISPYTRRDGFIDSTMYNTTSMLRTIELILGLRPMTIFDAGATPMWNAFTPKADTRPYAAEKPRIPLDTRNPAASAGLWKAAPVRSVFSH